MRMKALKKNVVIISQVIGVMFLTAIGVSADPIGGWAHNSNRNGKTVPLDSPLGIGILIGVGVFVLLVFFIVFRALKRRLK